MELDTADHRRSSGVTSGLHRMLTQLVALGRLYADELARRIQSSVRRKRSELSQ